MADQDAQRRAAGLTARGPAPGLPLTDEAKEKIKAGDRFTVSAEAAAERDKAEGK